MRTSLFQPLMCLALGVFAPLAMADIVELENGDRLTGSVLSIDGSSLVLDTDWGGTLVVDRTAVRAIETEGPLNLVVEGEGYRDVQLMFAESGEQAIALPDGDREIGFGAIALASVTKVPTAVRDDWSSKITYGLNIATGNSDTQAHSLRAATTLRRDTLRHAATADVDRSIDSGTVIRDQIRVGYQLDWFFSEDWYAYGSSEYFKDDIKEVDYRVTLGLGAGRQFWDNSLGALSAEAGVSAVLEDIGGEGEENPALRFGLDFNRFLYGNRLEFFNRSEALVLTDFDRGQIFNGSTGLRFRMNSLWSADLRVDVVHETEPAPGQEETDITYIIGLGFNW
jgi:putative salt-induced outer membrane protein YdiY